MELQLNGVAGTVTQVDFVGRNDQGVVTASGAFQVRARLLAQSSGSFSGEAELPTTTTSIQLKVSSVFRGASLIQQGVLEIRDPGALGDPVILTVQASDLDVKVPDLTGVRVDAVPPGPIRVGGDVGVVPSLPGTTFDPTPFLNLAADSRFMRLRDPKTQPGVFVPLRPADGVEVRATFASEPSVVVGAGPGGPPLVKVFAGTSGLVDSFFAFPPGFTGGVRVAAGDLDGDGLPEVVAAPDSGLEGTVRIFQPGGDPLADFPAYPGFLGGVRVASGDLDGDGRAEIVTGPGPGMETNIKVFDGLTHSQIGGFPAFPGFSGGVTVGTADLDDDGRDEIITGTGPGTNSKVRVFDVNGNLVAEFFPYSDGFQGGLNVSGGKDRIATAPAGPGAGGEVKIFDRGGNLVDQFVPFPDYDDGVVVTWGDFDLDGLSELNVLPHRVDFKSSLDGSPQVIYVGGSRQIESDDLSYGLYRVTFDPELDGLTTNDTVYVSDFFGEETATTTNSVSIQVDSTPSTTPRPLLVANSLGASVTGYEAPGQATGNAPPIVNLPGPFNLPFHFTSTDQERGDIYLSNNGSHSISVLPQPVGAGPNRTIQGPLTTLNFPTGTALDSERDILYVFDVQMGQGRVKAFHDASTADGDRAPNRILTGPFTNLFGAAYDPIRDRLYAAEPGADRILVFERVAELSGGVTPSRTLTVPGLTDPEGLFLDVPMQQLYVSSQSSGLVILGELDGAGSILASTSGQTGLRGVAFDPSTGTAYSSALNNEIRQFTIRFNPLTGIPGITAGSPPLAGLATLLDGPTGLFVRPAPPPPPIPRSL